MAWTYEPGRLAEGGKDRVRFAVGDTDPDDALLEDEEIEAVLSEHPDWREAAARCARAIASAFYREVTLKAGSVALEFRQRAESYERVAARLEREAGLAPPLPGEYGPGGAGSTSVGISAGGLAGPFGGYFRTGMMDHGGNARGDRYPGLPNGHR